MMSRKKKSIILFLGPVIWIVVTMVLYVVLNSVLSGASDLLVGYYLNLLGSIGMLVLLVAWPFGVYYAMTSKKKAGSTVKVRRKIALKLFLVPPAVVLAGVVIGRFGLPLTAAFDSDSSLYTLGVLLIGAKTFVSSLGLVGIVIGWPMSIYYMATPNKKKK